MDSLPPAARYCRHSLAVQEFRHSSRSNSSFRASVPQWAEALDRQFRGQTELALCESIKLLRFECEFALTAIRNNLFSGPTLLWGQTPLRYLLQVMDKFRIPQRSARVRALANGGKV